MASVHKEFKIQSDRRPLPRRHRGGCDNSRGIGLRGRHRPGLFPAHDLQRPHPGTIPTDVNYWGEQLILQDMVNVLERLIPTCRTEGQYLHPGPRHIEIAQRERREEAFWSLNTDAHLRSVLLGRSVSIPIVEGKMQLGNSAGSISPTLTR